MWQYNDVYSSGELYHFGIKGMKWGVRRYQNKDGSLTPAGKKRYSKEYEKLVKEGDSRLKSQHDRIYVDSYNKAVNEINSKGTFKRFETQQRKKYGENFADREGYLEDFNKSFSKVFDKHYNKALLDFYDNDESYQKAQALVDKYGMTKWDDLAKSNAEGIAHVRSLVEKKK